MFTRVNALGWALFEELTSFQMNSLDINMTRALDTFGGGTYNLGAPIVFNNQLITFNNNAHVKSRIVAGVDAEHTYSADDADVVIVGNLTATQTYHLDATGSDGDQLTFFKLESSGSVFSILFDSTNVFKGVNVPGNLKNQDPGDMYATSFVFFGTHWHQISHSIVPAP